MKAQIKLLKVYNGTPFSIYNVDGETLYPVSLAVALLSKIVKIGDIMSTKANYRSIFMQNDGIKYLFGVRIIDEACENPDDFKESKLSQFMQDQL
jgi:hypothetical protein